LNTEQKLWPDNAKEEEYLERLRERAAGTAIPATDQSLVCETKAKVLLVSLPGHYTGNEPLFPLGIGYLLAALRLDRPAQAVHYQVYDHAVQQLPGILTTFQPEIVGLTCTTFNRGNVRRICQWLAREHPGIRIVLGGVHVSFLPEQALRDYGADFVVIGEGEESIRELCDALDQGTHLAEVKGIAYLDNGEMVVTTKREPLRNLDELPIPDFSFAEELMRQSGMGFVISSRGCPVRCNFCSTGNYWGQRVRANSAKRVVDEMESLVARYGVRKIFFHDDTFNLSPTRVKELCSEITARGVKVEWGVSCRVKPVSQEMIDMMVAAGCRHICWGIESGSQQMLDRIEKKITLEEIRKAFELCTKHHGVMSVGAFMMVGNAGESAATIADSIDFVNSIKMTDPPSTAILYILPGTALYYQLAANRPELHRFWAESDEIIHYTQEQTLEQLRQWSEMISGSGTIIPFDRKRHFWNSVLFGDIPQPELPRLPFLDSELNRIIPPEIKDDEFYFVIRKLAAEADIRTVLEIGSSAGGGSTEAFVAGLRANPRSPQLFCMEVSRTRFTELEKRYGGEPFVHCYNVSSVPASSFPKEEEVAHFYRRVDSALNDYPLERVIGWLRQDIEYVTCAGVPQDGIRRIKREVGIERFDMVLIDGSEFTGVAELAEVYGAEYILLDDINGFKNHINYHRLKEDPAYNLLHENWQVRNGYAVFRKKVDELPIHFFTIVLNGEPYIRRHMEIFSQLPFKWHWHIVEGVADLRHDTAWSLENGARITKEMHCLGRSNDGTSEYLDEVKSSYPDNITLYRKPEGSFWDGKLEMVNAPLVNIGGECLLWQVDVDEIWTAEQIMKGRSLFLNDPSRSAAYYICRFFVGDGLVISTRDTYGNNTSYEWLRTWRYLPGDSWAAHEPPRLVRKYDEGVVDVATLNPFRHDTTEANNLVFDHYAYCLESQLRFKESYYGYTGAVESWKRLQSAGSFPVMLRDYFPWVKDNAQVDQLANLEKGRNRKIERILWVRSDSIGDNVLASSMLPHIRKHYQEAEITVVCQEHIAELYEASPCVDRIITFNRSRALRDSDYLESVGRAVAEANADLTLNSVYSREPLNDFLAVSSRAEERVAFHGDLSNITEEARENNNRGYTRLLASQAVHLTETERHREFLHGIGIDAPPLEPEVWIMGEDAEFAAGFFAENGWRPEQTVALFPCAQWEIKLYGGYGEALAEIARTNDFRVVGLGGEGDTQIVQEHLDRIGVASVNLAGAITLRQSAALLSLCRVAIGADSALAHIACAVGTPNVVLLGGGHFGRFMPYSPLTTIACLPLDCYGCGWHCRYDRNHCVKGVLPEVFGEAVRLALEGPAMSPRVVVQGESLWSSGPGSPGWRSCNALLAADRPEIITIEATSIVGSTAKHPLLPGGKEGPKISVVTVCFNAAATIEAAMASLFAQSYQNFEYIVIDGGSTDNTLQILEGYRERIAILVSEPDDGIYDAMNKGIERASGDVVYFLNADDTIYDEKVLEEVAAAFRRFPLADVIYGDALLLYPDGARAVAAYPARLSWDHFRERTLCHQSLFTRRDAFDRVGLFDTTYRLAADFSWIIDSIWNHDLNYQHLDRLLSTFSMGGSHGSAANLDLLERERQRAIVDKVAGRYDFTGSYQSARVTLFALTIGDPVFTACMEAIRKQDYPRFRVDVVENFRPVSTADQEMIRRCETDYFVKLDEDMILNPDAVRRMEAIMDAAPAHVGMICFHLFDEDRETRIQGIKIFRTSHLKEHRVRDVRASDMDLLDRLEERGVKWVLHDEIMGRHGTFYTPEIIYLRYKTMYEKDISVWNVLTDDIRRKADRFRESGDPLQLFALLGAVHGIIGAPFARDEEAKDFLKYNPRELELFRELFLATPPKAMIYDPARKGREFRSQPLHSSQVAWNFKEGVEATASQAPASQPRASGKRIMIGCTHFWPSVGGVETIAENLGANLAERGHRVDVATWENGERSANRHRGIGIISLDTRPMENGIPKWVLEMRELATSGEYDACILLADPQNLVIWSLEGARMPDGSRLLIQPLINEEGFANWRANREFRSRLAAILKGADGVIALSRDGAEMRFFREEGITPVYIPNATEEPSAGPGFRARHGIPAAAALLLHVANLWPVKNHDGLLRTLRETPGEWRLVMIGHPSGDEDYVNKVKREAALDPRVILIPGLPREEVDAAMAEADIVLLASHGEVSPVTIMEAMGHGRPWLATPSCGAVKDFAGGLVVPLEQFPETIARLMESPDLRGTLGRAGKCHWRACFNWERVTDAWEALINSDPMRNPFEMPAETAEIMKSITGEPQMRTIDKPTDSPLVSVIVPTHNRPEMLVETIRSILNQSYRNFEIIVVNDAGADVEGVVHHLNRDGNITYVRHSRNRGLAAARNTGIRVSRGKYLAYLDDDDIFYPDHLETLVNFLEGSAFQVAYTDACRAHQITEAGRYRITGRDLPYSYDFDYDTILVTNFVPVLCFMHERSCVDQTGLFDESLTTHEDWDMWIRMSRAFRFGHIKKTTCEFTWRQDGSTMTSSRHADFLRTTQVIYEKHEALAAGKPAVQEAKRNTLEARRSALSNMQPRQGEIEDSRKDAPKPAAVDANGSVSALERRLERADGLAREGKFDDAEAVYRSVLRGDNTNLRAMTGIGVARLMAGRLEEAQKAFMDVLEINPADAKALAGLGMVNCLQGRDEEGFACFSRALDSDPENLTALSELLKCSYRLDRFYEAEQRLESYLRYHPADLNMIFSLAGVQFRGGKPIEALDTVDKLLIFAPGYDGAQELKERIESITGNYPAPSYQYG
jgi:glycosyltransferase involved in cell wall biosynthesis/radical SAM superfamily enzyme YgiQ (UPF0313 family)/ADP-heptose:LPS heptosyltransferase/tetratricopeptide (TPR) repeat protein